MLTFQMEKPLVNSRSNKLKTLKGSSPLLFSSLLKIGKPNLSRILTAFENRIWRCAPSFLMVNIGFSTPLKNGKNALFSNFHFNEIKYMKPDLPAFLAVIMAFFLSRCCYPKGFWWSLTTLRLSHCS